MHGNVFSVIISPKHADRQLCALLPPCGALARPVFVVNPSLVFTAPMMSDVFRNLRRCEPPWLSRRGLVCNSFITNPTHLLGASFRLWESSYHCLPGLGYGCRARVILGCLTRNALSLIRFFFTADDCGESNWLDLHVASDSCSFLSCTAACGRWILVCLKLDFAKSGIKMELKC